VTVEDAVYGLWNAMSDRDWDRIGTFIADDCLYTDMCVGPAYAAKGPEGIVNRLRYALGPVDGYISHRGLLVHNGVDAMYEHSETWTWASGEEVLLNFVSVHRVVDGKVALWKDYWDYGAIANIAPESWLKAMAEGDLSWVYDATGEM
jgi:hypothetical protein